MQYSKPDPFRASSMESERGGVRAENRVVVRARLGFGGSAAVAAAAISVGCAF